MRGPLVLHRRAFVHEPVTAPHEVDRGDLTFSATALGASLIPMRWLFVLGFAACSGAPPTPAQGTSAAEAPIRDPASYPHTARIPLEAGELLLGADTHDSPEVALALQAPRGQLVLFACDVLEVETARNAFRLGAVRYESKPSQESLTGIVRRDALRRLATEPAPRLHTCDEEIVLDARAQALLRAFVAGQPPPTEERLQTRSVALDGLELSLAISNLEPDVVRLSLRIVEPVMSLDECELVVIVGGETFPLGLLSLEPGGPNPHRHDRLEARLPRLNAQRLSMEDEASLIVCGDVWLLGRHALENIRSLVGTP